MKPFSVGVYIAGPDMIESACFWSVSRVVTISRNKTPKKFKYCLHDHVLESVDKVNYMGVTISDDLKWESHINICGKANKSIFL
jgi:hypothetical protein